ncbi:MAG: hypothetical protein NTY09_14630 [bacterium]|nr:hypothetical protein [bacterium]
MKSGNKEDDPSILDSDILIRGVSARLIPLPIVYIPKKKKYQISPSVFIQSSKDDCISVYLDKIIIASGRTSGELFNKFANLVSLKAGSVRLLKLGIFKDPLLDEPAHANIFDQLGRTRSNFKKEVQSKLAEVAEVIPPP